MENKHFVFVYGTLKSDGHNNPLLSENGAQLISSKAWTAEGYCLVTDGCLPYLIEMKSFEGEVFGELWLVNDSCLEKLDRLEGHPNWYERKGIRVHVDEKLSYACKTYIMPIESLFRYEAIEGGVWKNKSHCAGDSYEQEN